MTLAAGRLIEYLVVAVSAETQTLIIFISRLAIRTSLTFSPLRTGSTGVIAHFFFKNLIFIN